MALFSFEVRDGKSGEYLGHVMVEGSTSVAAGRRALEWAEEEGYVLDDPREVQHAGAPAPEDYLLFKRASAPQS
jgi:hypothetical protein